MTLTESYMVKNQRKKTQNIDKEIMSFIYL